MSNATQKRNMLKFARSQHISRPFWNSILFGCKLEINALPDFLEPHERLLALAPCKYKSAKSLVVATSSRIIVLNRGLFGRLSNNSLQSVFYGETSGSHITGGIIQSLVISVPGDASNDIVIRGLWGTDADRINKAYANARAAALNTENGVDHLSKLSNQTKLSKTDQLDKLKGFLNDGDVTKEQYAKLRDEIINS